MPKTQHIPSHTPQIHGRYRKQEKHIIASFIVLLQPCLSHTDRWTAWVGTRVELDQGLKVRRGKEETKQQYFVMECVFTASNLCSISSNVSVVWPFYDLQFGETGHWSTFNKVCPWAVQHQWPSPPWQWHYHTQNML